MEYTPASGSNWMAASGATVPGIDWGALNRAHPSAARSVPAPAASWQTDFVNHLARSEAERNPNARMRIQLDVSLEADVELDHPVSVF